MPCCGRRYSRSDGGLLNILSNTTHDVESATTPPGDTDTTLSAGRRRRPANRETPTNARTNTVSHEWTCRSAVGASQANVTRQNESKSSRTSTAASARATPIAMLRSFAELMPMAGATAQATDGTDVRARRFGVAEGLEEVEPGIDADEGQGEDADEQRCRRRFRERPDQRRRARPEREAARQDLRNGRHAGDRSHPAAPDHPRPGEDPGEGDVDVPARHAFAPRASRGRGKGAPPRSPPAPMVRAHGAPRPRDR